MLTNSVILAGASVRGLAESAIRARLNPYCIDQFGDADIPRTDAHRAAGRNNCRIAGFDELPEILARYDHSMPLIWAGGLENHAEIVSQLSGTRLIAGLDAPRLQRVRDPFELHRVLTSSSCLMPEVRDCGDVRASESPEAWLLKPRRSAGGIGIRRIMRADDAAVLTNDGGRSELFLQKYVDGIPVSALYEVHSGEVRHVGSCLQIIGDKECGADGFQFSGNFGPISLTEHISTQLIRSGSVVGRSFDVQGCFGIDFILRNGQAYVVEVNPRITAAHEIFELTSRAGWNAVESQLRAFFPAASRTRGDRPAQRLKGTDVPTAVLRMILYAQRDTNITPLLARQLLAATQLHSTTLSAASGGGCFRVARLADIPQESVVAAGSPLCSVYSHKLPEPVLHGPKLPTFAEPERIIRQVSGLANFRVADQICRFERLSEILQSDNNLTPQRTADLSWNLS